MKTMGRVVVLFVLCLVWTLPAYASFQNGQKLVGWWRDKRNADNGERDKNYFSLGLLYGYTTGVADVLDGVIISLPTGTTTEQIVYVVGRYLDAHPEKWNKDADMIVLDALTEAFPLQGK